MHSHSMARTFTPRKTGEGGCLLFLRVEDHHQAVESMCLAAAIDMLFRMAVLILVALFPHGTKSVPFTDADCTSYQFRHRGQEILVRSRVKDFTIGCFLVNYEALIAAMPRQKEKDGWATGYPPRDGAPVYSVAVGQRRHALLQPKAETCKGVRARQSQHA